MKYDRKQVVSRCPVLCRKQDQNNIIYLPFLSTMSPKCSDETSVCQKDSITSLSIAKAILARGCGYREHNRRSHLVFKTNKVAGFRLNKPGESPTWEENVASSMSICLKLASYDSASTANHKFICTPQYFDEPPPHSIVPL